MDTQAPAHASATIDAPKLEINSCFFPLPIRYYAGHSLTSEEAVALEQVRRENIKANFAKKHKKLVEEGATPDQQEAEFFAFAEGYNFTKSRIVGAMDAVEKKAYELAAQLGEAALAQKGIKRAALADGVFEEFVENILNERPEIRDEAARQIALARSLSSGLSLPGA